MAAGDTLADSPVAGARVLHRFYPADSPTITHASDEDSSLVLPFRTVENRTISAAWIVAENYFFEWCVWLGYAVTGLAYPWPWCLLALLGQAIIVGSIFGVTGIPPTEKQAIRSKGDAYREYQQRVSRFIPTPPKRARPDQPVTER